jgi:hypothetical protein
LLAAVRNPTSTLGASVMVNDCGAPGFQREILDVDLLDGQRRGGGLVWGWRSAMRISDRSAKQMIIAHVEERPVAGY